MAESEEELKSLLKVKHENEKAGLKFNIQKTKIVASGPITSWQIDREKVETVTDFIFLGSQITAGSDRSHKIKWKQWQILFSWAPKSLQWIIATTKLKDTCSLEQKLWPA